MVDSKSDLAFKLFNGDKDDQKVNNMVKLSLAKINASFSMGDTLYDIRLC